MSTEELCASIEVYQTQLKQIEDALVSSTTDDEKLQLQQLQENLLQLLELTLQQLNEQSNKEVSSEKSGVDNSKFDSQYEDSENSSSNSNKNIDDEFALFQSEIAELTGSKSENVDNLNDVEEKAETKYTKDYLMNLEGTKCQAPFTEKWGGHSYHNCIILNVVTQEDGNLDLENPKVCVLFSQPTSLEMVPCRFFLSDQCKYSDESCRYSHGVIVEVSNIKEYKEPIYDSLMSGSRVLVRYSDDLWTPATIEDVLEDRSAFCVKIDSNKKVKEVQPEQMVPLLCEEHNSENEDSPLSNFDCDYDKSYQKGFTKDYEDCNEDSDDEMAMFIPTKNWLQHSLTQRLGEWEKFTKGIGSKLMQKMGYIVGTGLGPLGEGRVEPVVAYVYPQGVSLDRCMELREASNGEELLQVEKRLERQKRKEEIKSAQVAERLSQRTSVFDIINKKLGPDTRDEEEDQDRPVMNVSKSVLQKDSAKNLNMKNYQLSKNILDCEKEISKIEESKERLSGNKSALEVVENKLQKKKMELQKMKEAEKKVQNEQKNRKDAKKLCVF